VTIRALEAQIFDPAHIEAMRLAFHRACEALQLRGTSEAITEIVAAKIIEFAKAGEVDPERLFSKVLSEVSERQKAS
jgi:hypothetical protein